MEFDCMTLLLLLITMFTNANQILNLSIFSDEFCS